MELTNTRRHSFPLPGLCIQADHAITMIDHVHDMSYLSTMSSVPSDQSTPIPLHINQTKQTK